MKYIKVTIESDQNNSMKYPEAYDAQEVERNKRGPLIYNGNGEMLMKVTDELGSKYAQDPKMQEVSKNKADSFVANARSDEPDEKVKNSDRLLAIIAKDAAGETITQDDKDVLNPSSEKRGINKVAKDASVFEQ